MPISGNLEALDKEDFSDFTSLTAQESYSIEGQQQKMQMIEEMIRRRIEKGGSLNTAKIYHIPLPDGRHNLIVELGEDTEKPRYSVIIPSHVDTVVGDDKMLQLRQDPAHPDSLMGLGVYDMGAAVLNNIALASLLRVSPGMKVYMAFTVDEEENSLGARQILGWERWPEIDCVLSSEIGPLPPLKRPTDAPRLVIARAGREKFAASITVNPRAQGHGAKAGLPNASDAMIELHAKLRHAFHHGHDGSPLQDKHPLLGQEEFEMGAMESMKRPGYSPPHQAKFDFAVKTVPRRGQLLQQFREIARKTGISGEWEKFGISYTFGTNDAEECYDAYSLDAQHRLVQIVSAVIKQVSGTVPELVGAPSVADECVFAADMVQRLPQKTFEGTNTGVITIPINGDHAHHPEEWVSQHDILRNRHIIRALIEDPLGFPQLLNQK